VTGQTCRGCQHGLVDAVVDGAAGALDRVEGLVVGHSQLVNDLATLIDRGLFDEAHGRNDGVQDLEGSSWRKGELPAVPNLGVHHFLKCRCTLFGALVVAPNKHGL
jgi:hypothetical protein